MPQINDHIRLEIYDPESSWMVGEAYEFQVNPNSIEINDEILVVESNYLRADGGVVRPTQRKLRTITGSGKFFDIPTEARNAFPLVSNGKTTCFEMYQGLIDLMKKKNIVRFIHQYIGTMYVYIQNVKMTNTPSDNTLDFSFSLIETLIDKNTKTGFERDKSQEVPGMAMAAPTSTQTQFKEYKVVSGDTLGKIALKFYGDSTKWSLIYDYNKASLTKGPNVLRVGQILKIPTSTSAPLKISGGVKPATKYTPPVAKAQDKTLPIIVQTNMQSIDVSSLVPRGTIWNQEAMDNLKKAIFYKQNFPLNTTLQSLPKKQ